MARDRPPGNRMQYLHMIEEDGLRPEACGGNSRNVQTPPTRAPRMSRTKGGTGRNLSGRYDIEK